MKSKLKNIISLFSFFVVMSCIYALDYTTKITGIKMQPDFWAGVFPSSVSYMYELTGFNFIPDRMTELGLELETGTLARKFIRDPLTGTPISNYYSVETNYDIPSDNPAYLVDYPDYDTMYAGFNLLLKQGFFQSASEKDLLTISAGLKGRWEIALNPILDSATRGGSPFNNYKPFSDCQYLPGMPDLSGNRQLFDVALYLAGTLNDLLKVSTHVDVSQFSFELMYSPRFSNTSYEVGGRSEFFKFLINSTLSVTLYEKKDQNNNNISYFGFSNYFAYMHLTGENIPVYAQALHLPIGWYIPENSTFLFEDVLVIDYCGKQFFTYFIPKISLFLDVCYNWGVLNNTIVEQKADIFCASGGLRFELLIGSHFSLYYELGRIFAYTGDNAAYYLGFVSSNNIKIKVSVDF